MSAAAVNGVLAADIAAIKGVLSADIAALNGVAFDGGGGGDVPYDFADVLLFARCLGDDAATVFTDSSTYGRTVTSGNGATTSVLQSKFLATSLRLNGTNQRISIPSMSLTLPFTIMAWLYPTNSAKRTGWYDSAPSAVGTLRNYPNDYLEHQQDGTNRILFQPTVNAWSWNQIAFDLDGSNIRMTYSRGGVQLSQVTTTRTSFVQGANFHFGTINSGGDGAFEGFMSEIIIVDGVVPAFLPTAALPTS